MPSFINVMQAINQTYTREPKRVEHNRTELRNALADPAKTVEDTNSPGQLDDAGSRLLQAADPINGGIGQAPKFPIVVMLDFL